ncbi:MAG: hypothetical protein JO072_00820 [Parafilimonas sp.]|nr:hypothetical protein [Parafilimonas sp.]
MLLFTYAAFSKLQDVQMFKAQLLKFPLIGYAAVFLSWAIPVAEIITALLLFIPQFQYAGFIVSTILLTAFTLFLIVMVSFEKSLPCSCGGVIAKLTWREHIVFSLFFLILSLLGIYLKRKQEKLLST